MRKTPFLLALAASAAMAGLPSLAAAQSDGSAYGPAPVYEEQSYQQQWADYQARLQKYNEDRAAYDQQQQYRRHRGWMHDDHRDDVARRDDASCAGQAGARTAAGGLIGALAGAAIGSNLAERGSRTEGAVLGAVAGGVIGAGVADGSARCDSRGYYYSYNQTAPYRESAAYNGRGNGRYDAIHYQETGCRLVVAPANWEGHAQEVRYARVCPDDYGRYRLTD